MHFLPQDKVIQLKLVPNPQVKGQAAWQMDHQWKLEQTGGSAASHSHWILVKVEHPFPYGFCKSQPTGILPCPNQGNCTFLADQCELTKHLIMVQTVISLICLGNEKPALARATVTSLLMKGTGTPGLWVDTCCIRGSQTSQHRWYWRINVSWLTSFWSFWRNIVVVSEQHSMPAVSPQCSDTSCDVWANSSPSGAPHPICQD